MYVLSSMILHAIKLKWNSSVKKVRPHSKHVITDVRFVKSYWWWPIAFSWHLFQFYGNMVCIQGENDSLFVYSIRKTGTNEQF